jgi:hypothetical protein
MVVLFDSGSVEIEEEKVQEEKRRKGSLIGQGGGCSLIAAGVMVLSGLEGQH